MPRQAQGKGRSQFGRNGHRRAGHRAGCPTDQQRPAIEPSCIGAEHYGRECLDDPNAAEQLQLNGVLCRHEQNEYQRAALD